MSKNSTHNVDILHIAKLARLELEEKEIPPLKKDIESILDYADELSTQDLNDIEPTAHVTPLVDVYRLDEIGQTMDKTEALANAPEILDHDYIKVPIVVDND